MKEEFPAMMTIKEAAAYLAVSPRTNAHGIPYSTGFIVSLIIPREENPMSLDNTISDAERRARFKLQHSKRLDWLAVAINNMGGISEAAKQLGVSRMSLYGWLENGLSQAKFDSVVKLATLGDVPLEYLGRRLREHRGQPKTVPNGVHKQTTRRHRPQ